jgi:ribose-phosphate pyrophosphokinase
MILIAGASNIDLARKIARILNCDFVLANTTRFPDQELKVELACDLHKKNVLLLQSMSNPINDNLMELLLLADTAKKAECNSITAIIPYIGYARQNNPSHTHSPTSIALVAKLIETSGVDRAIMVDIHSEQSQDFFKIHIQNLNPTDLFIPHLKFGSDYIAISPDAGGIPRAKSFAEKLGIDFIALTKTRKPNGECDIAGITTDIKHKNCIIIDDIVDTGDTLCKAAELLMKSSARSVSACITHAVFSKHCIEKLKQLNFEEFFITDTIYHKSLPTFIKCISIDQLIAYSITS